mmetsp:Transcript_55505/g.148681  ORF Transcript_55505/g.148681 Transcript_55505/m.148681 type:complete len:85 (+) Transcript_55505:3-257(+)
MSKGLRASADHKLATALGEALAAKAISEMAGKRQCSIRRADGDEWMKSKDWDDPVTKEVLERELRQSGFKLADAWNTGIDVAIL